MKIFLFPLLLLTGCVVSPEQQQDEEPPTVYVAREPAPVTPKDQWREMRKESEIKDITEPTATSRFIKMMEAPATSAVKRTLKSKTKTKTKAPAAKLDDKSLAQTQEKPGGTAKPAAATTAPPEPPKKAGP